MEYTVPTLSIVFMAISMLAGVALPVTILIILRKKFGCSFLPFFVGCAVMLLFALVLESIAHSLILNSAAGAAIMSNVWLMGLYGGFMAGLFEESGRYIAFRTVLKRTRDLDHNALMYGAGHGGFEAFYLLSLTMMNNIIYSVMINSGGSGQLTAALSGDALAAMENVISQLVSTPPATFIMGTVERIAAIAAQIALSVLVWFAAKEGKKTFWLFPFAILLHMLLDAITVILSSYVSSILLLELVVYILAAGIVLIALKVWKRHAARSGPAEAELPPQTEENSEE